METLLQCIFTIRDYIVDSEMEGKVDKNDPWYPTYQALGELKDKIETEQEQEQEQWDQ